jgi:hypothetical protein
MKDTILHSGYHRALIRTIRGVGYQIGGVASRPPLTHKRGPLFRISKIRSPSIILEVTQRG